MTRQNYYKDLVADYSRPGLVSEELQAKLIQRSKEIGELQEAELAEDDPILHPPEMPAKSKHKKKTGGNNAEASECESFLDMSQKQTRVIKN